MELEIGNIIFYFPEHIEDIIKCIKYIVMAYIVCFIFVICIIPIIKIIASKMSSFKRKKQMNFNEFDDWEKIEQQEIEREQLENEWEFIEDVYKDRYGNEEKVRKKVNAIKIMDTLKVEDDEVKDAIQINKILEDDNNFDAELFKKWSNNIFEYVLLSNKIELEQIKSSISKKMFDKKKLQLEKFEKDNIELIRDEVLVDEIKIIDYSRGSGKDEIRVLVRVSLKEYIIKKDTMKIIRGNKKKRYEKSYILTFRKMESNEEEGFKENCDACGGLISETEFCRCKYCGSLVNPIRYNWILINFELL